MGERDRVVCGGGLSVGFEGLGWLVMGKEGAIWVALSVYFIRSISR